MVLRKSGRVGRRRLFKVKKAVPVSGAAFFVIRRCEFQFAPFFRKKQSRKTALKDFHKLLSCGFGNPHERAQPLISNLPKTLFNIIESNSPPWEGLGEALIYYRVDLEIRTNAQPLIFNLPKRLFNIIESNSPPWEGPGEA